jgi:hypothetical protein
MASLLKPSPRPSLTQRPSVASTTSTTSTTSSCPASVKAYQIEIDGYNGNSTCQDNSSVQVAEASFFNIKTITIDHHEGVSLLLGR